MGNAAQHCRLGLFQDSDFAGESWRLKMNIRRSYVHLRKSNTNQLDMQKANVSVSQLHRIWDHFAGCWFEYGRVTVAGFMGFGHWSAENDSRNTKTKPSQHTGNQCCTPKHTQDSTSVGSKCGSIERRSSSFELHISLRRNHSCTFSKITKLW